jgi:polar amino acid transport system substrate-binding protein
LSLLASLFASAICLCAALLASPVAAAQDESGKLYTVGVEDLHYYPLHTTGRELVFDGYAREVLDAFAQQQGIRFRYLPLPINRLYVAFLKEQVLDFKYPDNPRWKPELRAAVKISYSLPLVVSEEGAMVLPKNKGRPLGQLKSLGTALGFTPWPYVDDIARKRIALTVNNGFDSLLRRVMAGHIDAVYINVDVAAYLLSDSLKAPGALVFDPGLPHARSDFSLASRQHAELIGQFDAFLRREQPLLQKLKAKYGIADASAP